MFRLKDCCTYSLLHAQQDALTHNKVNITYNAEAGTAHSLQLPAMGWMANGSDFDFR
jgi:hypothetical protein